MARDWETTFRGWSRAQTEEETRKMERAETRIREAIAEDAKLQTHDVKVYRQGSYYNRTNVPAESDVDIRVEIRDVLFPDFYFVDKEAPFKP
jgi:tRNA nucleotidyltransferase (CCA-adding enzyme)